MWISPRKWSVPFQVLDYGILIISGPDGVQGHVGDSLEAFKSVSDPYDTFCKQNGSGGGTEKEENTGPVKEASS